MVSNSHRIFYYSTLVAKRTNDIRKKRRVLQTLAEVDAFLEEVNQAFNISSEAGFAEFDRACFKTDRTFLRLDPFSNEYRDRQLDLYLSLSGKDHYEANLCEETALDLELALKRPFPYQSGSASIAGEHIMAHGHLLMHSALAPGMRVLEFGAGWGQTTVHLARLGIEVTVCEISTNFCNYLSKFMENLGLTVRLVKKDMLEFGPDDGHEFDAIIFNESFHHCSDHQRLVENLQSLLKPGGNVIFSAEPINHKFPTPWGLRLDGQSLWAIRKNGWFELGFNINYFRTLLHRYGMGLHRKSVKNYPMSDLLIAKKQ